MKRYLLIFLSVITILSTMVLVDKAAPAQGFIFGDWQTTTIAENATTSSAINLGMDYDKCNIDVPTLTSANLTFLVARQSDGTYKQLGSATENISIVAGTGNFMTVLDLNGFQYFKIVSSCNQTATRTFYLRGH